MIPLSLPVSLPGVYAPQDDTELLVHALGREPLAPRARVLDVGTGTGAVALAAARRGALVTAVDISWRAVLNARVNAVLARLPMTVVRGDLLGPVSGRSFDLILSNPPYVPGPESARRRPGQGPGAAPRPDRLRPARGAARAWDGGWDGRLVLDRICRDSPSLLRPGGVLLLVHSALSDAERTLTQLRAAGLRADVVEHRRVAFGPVLRSRSDWLRGRGLLRARGNGDDGSHDGIGDGDSHDGDSHDGDEKEELVIIRAESPR
ncbi:methyltransferase [Streptomyces europaeiscabiei]|uniref:methyltransferase n=1 Tax=Streptomyces europaeiscabiei TaxID=146819 RepID=UPI0029ADE6F5|nr:methyltransferase [Streptomyces europaeiscabiei]MDX3584218.1 methyltransferase [Streptomyces europaeiscabiei]MDX3629539.1 methyltransferase [Streptomyces europaeiscabiei]MDX3648156.1 methyltransferase [Streptomyces europaeiscabiei]